MTEYLPEYCEECGTKLIVVLDGELCCPNCGLTYDVAQFIKPFLKDYQNTHAPPDSDRQPGTQGTPQMDLSIVRDKKGQDRVAGALFLEKWRKHHSP
jgi:uncharacterized Zn finger protein (UPF0148 family)